MEIKNQNNPDFKTAFNRAVTLQSAVNEKIKQTMDAKAESQLQAQLSLVEKQKQIQTF